MGKIKISGMNPKAPEFQYFLATVESAHKYDTSQCISQGLGG